MTIFIDTSAFYATLDADDRQHEPAKQMWLTLVNEATDLVCSNYVIVRNHGLGAEPAGRRSRPNLSGKRVARGAH
jgi:predicted nucleic acid-binding protein